MLSLFKTTVLLSLATSIFSHPVDLPKSHDYIVENLPGLQNIPESERPIMYAGHIEINNETDTNYFFWKFVKQESSFNRTIIWLNGGPGCSSMDGALMEVGPLRVFENGDLYLNQGSWYHAADMIFVDQPGGTGFSTTKDYDKELDQIAEDFKDFVTKYFEAFPEDATNEIYIAGESYAGQYIPFIADRLIRASDDGELDINLKGLLIGNGWIAPNIQSLSYIPYMLDAGIINIHDDFFPKLLNAQEKCQNEINSGEKDNQFSIINCEGILNKILSYTRDREAPKDQQCLNMYDTRLRDSYPSCGMNWPPDLPNIEPWLRNKDVVESLNLDVSRVKEWRECDGEVSKYLKNKSSKPSFGLLPGLLERMPIILFSGDRDIICNSNGLKAMISELRWGGSKGFTEDLPEYDWKYDGETTGAVKSENNLTWIDVYESSHMVPFDKPFESRGLFDIMVGNFKVVETLNGTHVETPVYTNTTWFDNEDDDSKSEGHPKNVLPFLFYLATIGIIGVALYLYNKSKPQKNSSILRNNRKVSKQHNKKSVSWADENNTLADTDYKSTGDAGNQSGGSVGKFFNNFRSQEPGYKPANSSANDDYEDIELQTTKLDNEDFDFDIEDELERGEGSNPDGHK